MKTAALIPCRTGSKGIPGKNFKQFVDRPLWKWTYDAAVKSGVFDMIVISSDGGFQFYDDGGPYPAEYVAGKAYYDNARPKELSNDTVTLDKVLLYYAEKYPDIDVWCLLQPTSPLRTAKDIQGAFKMIQKDKHESVVSVIQEKGFYWVKDAVDFQGKKLPIATYNIDKRPNRQDRKDWYAENGAIYFTKKYALEATQCRCGGEVGLFVMSKEHSLEIDDQFDWKLAEFVGGA